MQFARVQSGTVAELFAELPDLHPDIMATIHDAPDDVQVGWTYDGSTYAAPSRTAAEWAGMLEPGPESVGLSGTVAEFMEGGI